jgi:hypothetical protein
VKPRILITCSRSWTRWSEVRRVLTEVHRRYPDAVLVHGDAPQGDRQVAGIWESLGGATEPHPADWKAFGRAAGFRRNAAMVESSPAMTIAFIRNSSSGASHTASLSEGAGIPTVRYFHDDHPIEGTEQPPVATGTAVRSYPYSKEEGQ